MSIEERLQQKVDTAPEFVNITDLPDNIKLKLQSSKFKTDSRGNEALFVYLVTEDNKTVVQKYTHTSYDDIAKALKSGGGSAYLMQNFVQWSKANLGQMTNPRLIPEPKAKAKA